MYVAIALRPNCLFSHSKYLDSSLLVFSLCDFMMHFIAFFDPLIYLPTIYQLSLVLAKYLLL